MDSTGCLAATLPSELWHLPYRVSTTAISTVPRNGVLSGWITVVAHRWYGITTDGLSAHLYALMPASYTPMPQPLSMPSRHSISRLAGDLIFSDSDSQIIPVSILIISWRFMWFSQAGSGKKEAADYIKDSLSITIGQIWALTCYPLDPDCFIMYSVPDLR